MELAVRAKTILTEKDHSTICKVTESACFSWRDIGRKLGFEFEQLTSIVHKPGCNGPVDYYEAVIMMWLRQMPVSSTNIERLSQVLYDVGHEKLAHSLLHHGNK